jgi:hypothetical protein
VTLPPAWAELAAHVNGRTEFGMKGVRDPDAVCDEFEPGESGRGHCDTDGHYMCKECEHMSRHAVLYRQCTQKSSCKCELCLKAEEQDRARRRIQ